LSGFSSFFDHGHIHVPFLPAEAIEDVK
jgi:hypothetical protein